MKRQNAFREQLPTADPNLTDRTFNTIQQLRDTEKGALAIFTACSVNYLTKAVAMCRSALDNEPDATIIILLVDRRRAVQLSDKRIRIIWSEDLGAHNYLKLAFKYNIIEFNTSLKPLAALILLDLFDRVIYLDPDICVYAPLTPVHQALETNSIVLTPHAMSPYPGHSRPDDQDLLRFGAYNLGFFGVRDDFNSRSLLTWWNEQCMSKCFYEPQVGFAVDQRWMDLAPSFFEGICTLKDPGLNVAFWNLHERCLSNVDGTWMVNDQFPLRFIHFSSFVEDDDRAVAHKQTRYESGSRQDFALASKTYRNYLEACLQSVTVDETEYGYAYFTDGTPICPTFRRFYAVSRHPAICTEPDPFSSVVVRRYAKANHLSGKGQAEVAHQTFKTRDAYSMQQMVISRLFRFVLLIVGPDRYFLLMRYLSNYSSILNQTDISRSFDKRFRI